MIWHVVLMRTRPDLQRSERAALVDAFERAMRDIPGVREVRMGRRVTHGASYERVDAESPEYFVSIGFDDLAGLHAYLAHAAHEDLGLRFGQTLRTASVFDFEAVNIQSLKAEI
jgi:hypothetical protein